MKLTKAYIVEKVNNQYRVRIPIYHGIEGSSNYTPDEELPLATASTIKGANNIYLVGDVVYVDFEENDLSKPVIFGALMLDDYSKGYPDMQVDSLTATGKVVLPESTSIGKVTSTEIAALAGIKGNIQNQIHSILTCNSTFEANYNSNEFRDSATWIIEDNGIAVKSKLLDDVTELPIDTYALIQAKAKSTLGSKIVTVGDEDNPIELIQSDGYDNDYRFRLNWHGVNTVENDAVKMSMGLYARNYWKINASNLKDGSRYLMQPEYTWRPTIQSYTSRKELALATINADEANSKVVNTGYYPYSMQLNPDGGDIYLGRSGAVSVIDHDDSNWQEGSNKGKKQGIQIGDVFLFVDDSNKLKQHDINTGVITQVGSGVGGSSGTAYFTHAQITINNKTIYNSKFMVSGSTVYSETESGYISNGTIYRLSPDGTIIYKYVNNIYQGVDSNIEVTYSDPIINIDGNKEKSGTFKIGGYTYNITHVSFAAPYIRYQDTAISGDPKYRELSRAGLYAANTDEEGILDTIHLLAGYIEFKIELLLGVSVAGENVVVPVTAVSSVQLGTLHSLASDGKTIQLDLASQVGYGWDNMMLHFIIQVTPEFRQIEDIVTLNIKNVTNFITIIDLSDDNVVAMHKARLLSSERVSDTQVITEIATVNVNAVYHAVDTSDVSISTVKQTDNNSYEESI